MGESVSNGKKPKVTDRRHLRPDEANRLMEAAGQRGRHPFRDTVLVRLVYRHGLRASEAVGMRWSQIDLDAGVIHIVREAGKQAALAVDAHPHMLRHAAGYMLANAGTDTQLIQAFFGHRDIRHTAHYTAIAPKRLAGVRVR